MIRETAKGYLATQGNYFPTVPVALIRETPKWYLATQGSQFSLVLVAVIRCCSDKVL